MIFPEKWKCIYSILGNNGQNEVKTPFRTNIAANRKYIHV